MRLTILALIACAVVVSIGAGQRETPSDTWWPVNGGVDNIRYSPLSQINRETVPRLAVAWTYDSHDAFKGSEMQSNPIVVDGVVYVTTPTLKVVAVDARTGREIWKFDPSGGAGSTGRFRHRGVTVHKDRVFVTSNRFGGVDERGRSRKGGGAIAGTERSRTAPAGDAT